MLAQRYCPLPQIVIADVAACLRPERRGGKRVLRSGWLAPIVASTCLIASSPASSQVAGSVSVDSDYRFRGYSLSDDRPVATAQVSFDHSSNIYANAAITAVDRTDGIDLLGLEANLGFARHFGSAASLDLGIVHKLERYACGHDCYSNATYTEGYAGLSIRDVSARIYYSPHYFETGASTLYGELEAGVQPISNLRLSAHVGGLTYLTAPYAPYFAYRSRYDWRLSASRQLGRFEVHSALSGGGPHIEYSLLGDSGTVITVGASVSL